MTNTAYKVRIAKHEIVRIILNIHRDRWMATHEICKFAAKNGDYMNDASVSALLRSRKYPLQAIVEKRVREGTHYKEYRMISLIGDEE